jgi:predicted acyl esterase
VRNVRAFCLIALATLAGAPAAAEDAATTPPAWRTDDFAVAIPMRDGVSLAADVYLPPKPGRYPAVVIQTPYDRKRHRAALGGGQGGFGGGAPDLRDGRAGLTAFADREHYAYVVVDWRGFHGSRAAGSGARPGAIGRDGHDVVEWTAAQPWCDGKVGTWGPSALGGVQFQTAAQRPPHLVCAVPLVAAYGYRYEDYFQDGVLREHHVASLDRLGFGTGSRVREARDPGAPIYRLAKLAETPAAIDVPVLMVTGWFDHGTARQIETFRTLLAEGGPRVRAQSRLMVGPWHHTAVDLAEQGDLSFPGAAGASAAAVRAWFDRWLRGVGDGGWAADERVRFWRPGEEGWTGAAEWPRPGGPATSLTLHADGRIDEVAPSADEAPRAFLDDPEDPVPTVGGANLPLMGLVAGPVDQAPLLARPDVLAWTTAPLAAPLRLEGTATVTLSVRIDAPDTDVAVRLCSVGADGRTILLADSIVRASFTSRGREPLDPGEPREVEVRLPPLSWTWAKGTRMRVLVSGTNSPRFERNGHTGSPTYEPERAVAAKVEILQDAAHPARIVLPLAPPSPPPPSAPPAAPGGR